MKIIVTGASGAFGGHAARLLLETMSAADLILLSRTPDKLAHFAVQGADGVWRFRTRTVRLWDGEVLKKFPGRGTWVARKRPDSLKIKK